MCNIEWIIWNKRKFRWQWSPTLTKSGNIACPVFALIKERSAGEIASYTWVSPFKLEISTKPGDETLNHEIQEFQLKSGHQKSPKISRNLQRPPPLVKPGEATWPSPDLRCLADKKQLMLISREKNMEDWNINRVDTIGLVVTGTWLDDFSIFFHRLGMSSSQLTNSYLLKRGRYTTN